MEDAEDLKVSALSRIFRRGGSGLSVIEAAEQEPGPLDLFVRLSFEVLCVCVCGNRSPPG